MDFLHPSVESYLAGLASVDDEPVLVEMEALAATIEANGILPTTGEANLVFFQGAQWFIKAYQPGEILAVSGPPELFGGTLQWTHPELERIDRDEERLIHSGRIIPQYREGAKMKSVGLTSRSMRTLIESVFELYAADELKDIAARIRARGTAAVLAREELLILMLDEYRMETRDLL